MVLFPLSPKVNGGMTLIIINVPQCFLVEACGLGRVNNWHFLKLDTLQRTLGQNPSTEGIDGQKVTYVNKIRYMANIEEQYN